MRRTDVLNSLVESESCDQLRSISMHAAGDENDEHDHEGAAHQPAAQVQVAAGEQHEGDAERHALVGHVGVEHDARQSEIDGAADDEQRPHQRMKVQDAVAHRPDHARAP